MKHWQKHRLVAMFLLIATFFGVIPFATTNVNAADTTSSTETGELDEDIVTEELYGGRTLDEIIDLISGMSYDVYRTKWNSIEMEAVSEHIFKAADVIVPHGEIDTKTGAQLTTSLYDTNFTAKNDKGEDISGVYTPSSGKTTFKIDVPTSGLYAIDLLYYPVAEYNGEVVSTKTTIERMFYLDGELPFNECRYLYIPRSWEYVATNGIDELYREGEPVRADYGSDREYQDALDEWAMADENGGAGNYLWDKDIQNNDIRPDRLETPTWRTYFLRDWLGYTVEPFQFYLEAGTHYFTFEATREPLVISEIKIYGYTGGRDYSSYLDRYMSTSEVYSGDDVYLIEAESPVRVSDQVLFPGTDRTSCINSPSHPSDLVYNLINSSVVGQYMVYKVYIKQAGLYNIVSRFRQNTMAGMFTSRRIKINGEVPFKEASYLQYNYKTTFQNTLMGDDKGVDENGNTVHRDYLFYLEEGWNEIEIEVVLGDMSEYIYDIANVIATMTADYNKLLTITGVVPDAYRDYGFSRLMPDVISDLATCALELDRIYNSLVEITGATGQHIVTLDTIRRLVQTMAEDEYEIAPNFLQFKNYMTALSNWLYTSLSQPLKLDYLQIQSQDKKVPKARAGFFYAIGYEAKAFVSSFFKDYNVIGFKTDNDGTEYEGTILMWNTTSREDALILRTMIDGEFTPESNIAVNIRYVAQGLQESILAGVGPDVAMMGSGTAVSWGLRNAVEKLSARYEEGDDIPEGKQVGDEVYEGFGELCEVYTEEDVANGITTEDQIGEFVVPVYDAENDEFNVQFSHAALEAVSLDNVTYLLPCTMNFEMSFYRIDIFADHGIKPPRTWQELKAVLPQLINEHLTMGMQTSLAGYQMILYQMGEQMYANDYQSFNQNTTAKVAFDFLCTLFNDYSLPISGVDLTRFRTGEIPIYVANWTTYNSFMGYYELRGLWTMESLIGYEHYKVDENGETVTDLQGNPILDRVDRSSILNVEGIVIPRGSDNPQHVWKYMNWYAGESAQTRLARQQLAASSNTTVKYNSANLNALLNQAWTTDEKDALLEQIPHLKGIPFNPGDYNISRYVNFAFLAAYNNNANPVDSLLNYVVDIDKELSRKREEYHLPFIDYYNRFDDSQDEAAE